MNVLRQMGGTNPHTLFRAMIHYPIHAAAIALCITLTACATDNVLLITGSLGQ